MGFIMDGLDAEDYDRKYRDRDLIARIAGYFKAEGKRILIVGIAIFGSAMLYTALPITISNGLDELQSGADTAVIARIALLVVALGVFAWVFNAIRQWLSATAIGNVTLKLREDAFDAVMKRDLSFYDQFPSGKIVSRVTSDTQAFSEVVRLTMELLSQLLLIVFLVVYLASISLNLTMILILLAPLIVLTALIFRRIARVTVTQSRRVNAEVNSHIQETISGIRIAKAFRQESTIYNEFLDVNQQSYGINLRNGYTFSSIFPILNILAGFGTAALIYFGGLLTYDGTVSAGEWFLFIQGLAMFWYPLTSIASFWSQFQIGLAAGERVFALIDAEPNVVQTSDDNITRLQGKIEFQNVSFRYTEKEQVLENFSLTIRPGETLALVGHTGSGKSSIGKLIARFYEFQNGKILIDGQDIRSIDLQEYHKQLGIVTQTPFLFDGTVRDNIRYGYENASDEEVLQVAQMVGHGDWIKSLPNGLDMQVGERGNNLSMGQRQLVAIARVLIQKPAIFILDEATANVDPFTEAMIQEGLDIVLKDRTSIVIAHRLSTIKHADRIVVLDHGKIIEEGSHDALLAKGGHYADLYNTYFRHQSLEYIEEVGDMLA